MISTEKSGDIRQAGLRLLLSRTRDAQLAMRIVDEIGVEACRVECKVGLRGDWVVGHAKGPAKLAAWVISHCVDAQALETIAEEKELGMKVREALRYNPHLGERARWLLMPVEQRTKIEPRRARVEPAARHTRSQLDSILVGREQGSYETVMELLRAAIHEGHSEYVDRFVLGARKIKCPFLVRDLVLYQWLGYGDENRDIVEKITIDAHVALEKLRVIDQSWILSEYVDTLMESRATPRVLLDVAYAQRLCKWTFEGRLPDEGIVAHSLWLREDAVGVLAKEAGWCELLSIGLLSAENLALVIRTTSHNSYDSPYGLVREEADYSAIAAICAEMSKRPHRSDRFSFWSHQPFLHGVYASKSMELWKSFLKGLFSDDILSCTSGLDTSNNVGNDVPEWVVREGVRSYIEVMALEGRIIIESDYFHRVLSDGPEEVVRELLLAVPGVAGVVLCGYDRFGEKEKHFDDTAGDVLFDLLTRGGVDIDVVFDLLHAQPRARLGDILSVDQLLAGATS